MSAVKVAVRTRPTASFAADNIHVEGNNLTLKMPKGENPNATDSWSYRFDAVLHNASQLTTYEQVQPVVASVTKGFNGTIMCYGQTGAGKTFTMMGGAGSFKDRGIAPRAIGEIFQAINQSPDMCTVQVSYVEIYQDTFIDLLSTLPTGRAAPDQLVLVEDEHGATYVRGLRQETVSSEEEALAMLFEGQSNRQVANHQLNRNSTRGHAVFTLHMQMLSRSKSSGTVTKCKLNLVDLAGSERLKKTATEGGLRSESMYINRSLTFLEQVVVALASKGRSHTPYRQSKLTHLLKDSLGGNCKTLLIANVYGENTHLEETISTLAFAQRVRLVPNEAVKNVEHDPEMLLKQYAREIAELKSELAMHDSLASRSRIAYEPYSDSQRVALMEELQSFLTAEGEAANEINLESVRQMRELLSSFKSMYSSQQQTLDDLSRSLSGGGMGAGDAPAEEGAAEDGGDGEGAAEPTTEFEEAMEKGPDVMTFKMPTNRNDAFHLFKQGAGAELNAELLALKARSREQKTSITELVGKVNSAKREIDAKKDEITKKAADRDAENGSSAEVVIDEEEYKIIQEHKKAKEDYKRFRADLEAAQQTKNEVDDELDTKRRMLVESFETWFASNTATGAVADEAGAFADNALETQNEIDDEDEAFEKLQMNRILATDPDSLAFVRARKAVSSKTKKPPAGKKK